MTSPSQPRFEARARILKALAHPTRLHILHELSREVRSVAELAEAVGADVSTVSRHLGVLRGVGVVVGTKSGVQVIYGLRAPCVMNFFDCVEAVIRSRTEEELEEIAR